MQSHGKNTVCAIRQFLSTFIDNLLSTYREIRCHMLTGDHCSEDCHNNNNNNNYDNVYGAVIMT